MKKHLVNFTFMFALLIFLLTGCGWPKEAAEEQEVGKSDTRGSIDAELIALKKEEAQNLQPAPDFRLPDLEKNTFTLSSYKERHQPVILFFWTTWCPYCREELKILKDLYPEFLVDGWELFAINVGEPANRVDNFAKSYSLPFKILLDITTSVAKSFYVLGVPTYVFVDKNGYIMLTEHYFPHDKYREFVSE